MSESQYPPRDPDLAAEVTQWQETFKSLGMGSGFFTGSLDFVAQQIFTVAYDHSGMRVHDRTCRNPHLNGSGAPILGLNNVPVDGERAQVFFAVLDFFRDAYIDCLRYSRSVMERIAQDPLLLWVSKEFLPLMNGSYVLTTDEYVYQLFETVSSAPDDALIAALGFNAQSFDEWIELEDDKDDSWETMVHDLNTFLAPRGVAVVRADHAAGNGMGLVLRSIQDQEMCYFDGDRKCVPLLLLSDMLPLRTNLGSMGHWDNEMHHASVHITGIALSNIHNEAATYVQSLSQEDLVACGFLAPGTYRVSAGIGEHCKRYTLETLLGIRAKMTGIEEVIHGMQHLLFVERYPQYARFPKFEEVQGRRGMINTVLHSDTSVLRTALHWSRTLARETGCSLEYAKSPSVISRCATEMDAKAGVAVVGPTPAMQIVEHAYQTTHLQACCTDMDVRGSCLLDASYLAPITTLDELWRFEKGTKSRHLSSLDNIWEYGMEFSDRSHRMQRQIIERWHRQNFSRDITAPPFMCLPSSGVPEIQPGTARLLTSVVESS